MFLMPGSRARQRGVQSVNNQRGLLSFLMPAQGRITISAGNPVLSSDPGASTSIFYSPYTGGLVPVFNGSVLLAKSFLSGPTDSTGLTLAMAGSANWVISTLYDLFYAHVSGVFYFGTGPAWSSSTAGASSRGTGAGTTELQLFNGLWTNKNAMTLRYAPSSTVQVFPNQATFLGTFFTTAAGTTNIQFRPAAAATGSNSIVGYQNVYNKVPLFSKSEDSTASWAYASATWRDANNSSNNRIRFIDCLGTTSVKLLYSTSVSGASASAAAATVGVGFNIDVTTATNVSGGGGAGFRAVQAALNNTALGMEVRGEYNPIALAGLNFAQAGEQSTAVSINFFGNDFMMLSVEGLY